MRVAYVDPGKHFCGVARFFAFVRAIDDNEGKAGSIVWLLDYVEYRPIKRVLPPGFADDCVCEKPQILSNRAGGTKWARARPSDVAAVMLQAGRMCANLPTRYVLPNQWKGQVPKEIQHARMHSILTPAEKLLLASLQVRKSLLHNVYDAVCIGLTYTGRFNARSGS